MNVVGTKCACVSQISSVQDRYLERYIKQEIMQLLSNSKLDSPDLKDKANCVL
jgi:hypothetical protein